MPEADVIRVLLVEDNAADAVLIREQLRESALVRYAVHHEERLEAACAWLTTQTADVVLLDLSLPDSQGFATFEKMAAAAAAAALVVFSGLDDQELALRTVTAGAQDYLVKGQADALLLSRAILYAIERKRNQDALAQEHDLLRALIDSYPDHIYVKDRAGRFLVGNTAVAAFFRLGSPDHLRGRTDADFFSAELAAQFAAEDQEILATGQPVLNREGSHIGADGQTRWVLTSKVPLRDRRGQIIGTVGVNRDITERRRAEQALQQLNADLARSQRELWQVHEALQHAHEELKSTQDQLIQAEKLESVGRLAAGIAHEVKNPLAVIQLGIDYLSDGVRADDPNREEVIDQMRNAIGRADGIVRGLVDFSARRQLDLPPRPIVPVLRQTLELLRHELHRRRIQVHTEFSRDLPAAAIDPPRITQVFLNLLQNAIQAMPNGGTINVLVTAAAAEPPAPNPGDRTGASARGSDRAIVVKVQDTGPGISQETVAHLFEPFYTTKPAGQGTGLGLSVARKIVELHRGTLEIGNRPGGGVQAVVTLPAVPG